MSEMMEVRHGEVIQEVPNGLPDGIEQDGQYSLSLSPDTPIENWLQAIDYYDEKTAFVGNVEKIIQFHHGDLLRHGRALYGQDYSQGLPDVVNKKAVETKRGYLRVAERIAPSTREKFAGLSYSHFKIAAALDYREQEAVFQQAVENNWTVRELGRAVKGDEPDEPPRLEEPTYRAVVKSIRNGCYSLYFEDAEINGEILQSLVKHKPVTLKVEIVSEGR